MKLNLTLTIALCLILTVSGSAQLTSHYVFSGQSTGTYEPITGGTLLFNELFDDQVSPAQDIPSFAFDGETYNQFYISPNGYLTFGEAPSFATYLPLSSSAGYTGCISPFGRDIRNAATGTPEVRWETIGNEIVIQWQDVARFSITEEFSFQARLNLLDGTIRFIYDGSTDINSSLLSGPQVGLRGATNDFSSDVLNQLVTTENNWLTSEPGTANNSSCRFSSSVPATFPSAGLTYTWSMEEPIPGCTVVLACNYDPEATLNDGSCDFSCLGCVDALACNYAPGATMDDGTCDYCSCDAGNPCGCIDTTGCNYDVTALYSNDECDYSCHGCTDENADNYDPGATYDNGTCYYYGEGATCGNPIELLCAEGLYTNMTVGVINDNALSGSMACGGPSSGGQRWYVYTPSFSSEVTVGTISSMTNFDTYLKVFTGACGSLECVTQNDDIPGANLQSQCIFNAAAGTTYYIRVGGFVQQSGTFGLTISCGGGCLDEDACNYDEDAPFDDGSCTYGADCFGCTDVVAANYSPIAVYENGTCQYSTSILVYHDLNGDGAHQPNEPGLSNWAVYIGGLQSTLYSNAQGIIELDLPASPFILELINSNDNWISTTPSTAMIIVPDNEGAQFGLIPSSGETFFVAGPYNGFWDIIHCTDGYEAGVFLNNTGAVSLNGTLTLTCDPMFIPEADAYGTIAPDLVAAGFAQWNLNDYLPGSAELFSFHVDGPGVEYLNDIYPFDLHLVLTDGEGNEIYNETWTTDPHVACSYDPNDISATPEGYEAPHFILPGQRVEYRIRFQNTGNLPAEDILIMDQLDPEVFDLSSFLPLYASASVTTCLHDDGLVDFMFNDIYLPDSTNDEEGSHGYVLFAVNVLQNLNPGTIINNYADIYFEQNPAITTNTAFHTIFDCGGFEVLSTDLEVCNGESLVVDATQPYVSDYIWALDGEPAGGSPAMNWAMTEEGIHLLSLEVANPLCGASSTAQVLVHPSPQLEAGSNQTLCEGEMILLDAIGNGTITWSNGALNQAWYLPDQTGILVATAANEFNCTTSDQLIVTVNPLPVLETGGEVEVCENEGFMLSATGSDNVSWSNNVPNNSYYFPLESEIVFATGSNEFNCSSSAALNITVNEIPGTIITQTGMQLEAPEGNSWQWYLDGVPIDGEIFQSLEATQNGTYYVITLSDQGCQAMSETISIVSVEVKQDGIFCVYPNPMHESTVLQLPEGIYDITLIDISGRVVRSYPAVQTRLEIERGLLASGQYQIVASGDKALMIMKVLLD